MTNTYIDQLNWAKERGLFLDPRVERKCVKGVWGLFANNDIPGGTKLISYPVTKGIKNHSDDIYSASTSLAIKNIHRAVEEYVKGDASEYFGHFIQFESLDSLKGISTYFFKEEEIKLLESMNYVLANVVRELNNLVNSRVLAVQELEPEIDSEIILLVVLNYASRAWDDSNFLPVIDYANHSDRLGMVRGTKNGEYLLEAKRSYKKGDQIFLSYARKDMYVHAISYNYFDPNGSHYIQFGARFVQAANTEFEKEIVKYTASRFSLSLTQVGDTLHYRCLDPDVCFLETAPSLGMIDYIRCNYFSTEQEWHAKQCSVKSLIMRLLEVLNLMLSANQVDKFEISAIPSKLHRFYHLLKKEKQMLLKNKEWVIDNFYI